MGDAAWFCRGAVYHVTRLVDMSDVVSKESPVERSHMLIPLSSAVYLNAFRLHLHKCMLACVEINIAKAYDLFVARTTYDSYRRVA